MAGQHHQCNEQELGQTLGGGEGQRGLVCCSPWGHKESDTTGWLNNDSKVTGDQKWANRKAAFRLMPWDYAKKDQENTEGSSEVWVQI